MQLNYIYNSPAKLKRALAAPFCTVHDGTYRFAYETYYIKPEAQLEQLHPYFQVERVLELTRGAARRKSAGDDGFEVGVLLLQSYTTAPNHPCSRAMATAVFLAFAQKQDVHDEEALDQKNDRCAICRGAWRCA